MRLAALPYLSTLALFNTPGVLYEAVAKLQAKAPRLEVLGVRRSDAVIPAQRRQLI